MTTLRTAAQQALEALENTSPLGFNMESDKKFFAAITSLRAALEEPVQEPVESALQAVAEKIGDQCAVWYGIGARDVEEVLREAVRHGLVHGALAEPVQEPVGYWDGKFSDSGAAILYEVPQKSAFGFKYRNAPLYAAPTQRPAEPVQDTGVKLKPVFYAPRRLDDEEIEAIVGKPVQEPPCATRECMPSECPNCVSLQDQNTELDRKLADLEQTSLELCNVCGWKTLIPGDCCLNCVRKPMNEFDALRLITESIGRLQSAGPVEGLIGIIRAVERAHGIP